MNRSERLRCWLRETIEYQPADLALFETALTHRSADGPNNERLEFLGDAVLGMITAQYLFERFTDADEGAFDICLAHGVQKGGVLGGFHRDLREENHVGGKLSQARHEIETFIPQSLELLRTLRVALPGG